VGIKPNSVRLGIEAPSEIPILREEVLLRGESCRATKQTTTDTPAGARLIRIKQILTNRLTNVALGLDLLRQQASASAKTEQNEFLARLEEDVLRLDQQLRELLSETPMDSAGGVTATSGNNTVSPCAVIVAEDGSAI
jgi:hypothetical protein